MPNNNNRINFQVGYNVDQASVNAVKKSLQDLQNIKFKDFNGPKKDLDDIKQKASQVEAALNKAFNVNLNSLNTQSFNAELQKAGLSIDKIYSSFSKAGAQGQVAFSRMASEVLTTNMQLKQTNSLVSQMGETMANTVKWGIASSVMNTFTNSVRQAFDYVKALDSSLNDIRIVTKQSSDQMANFAVQANNSAQALGRSTMDYTKAALTFYQQGLDEASVQARTESVLKAQNITGAGDEMADYLTAVWNGYKVANEEAELYVDKLAAVADSSASNMSQLAIAMSKVASSANLLGVPVDKLNAQIATITATTRQAPETVGNALKTIYSRINDIATGADDAEISLGNYSSKMAEVGINVLDANGRLRDTGDVIDEIGGKWETLSHEQQIYLARTMAGQRQYNNLLALFENWGKYSDLVNVSMQAQGTTAQKNAIYMESLAAKMEQLGAAGERVKSALIDEDDLKGLVSFGTGIVNTFGTLIESIGGGKTAILALGSIFTQVFSGTIAKQLNNVVTHFQDIKNNAQILKQSIASTQLLGKSQGYQEGAIREMVDAKKEIASYYSLISAEQLKSYNNIVNEIGKNKQDVILLQQKVSLGQKYKNAIQQAALKTGQDFDSQHGIISEAIEELTISLDKFKSVGSLKQEGGLGFDQLQKDILNLSNNISTQAIPNFQQLQKLYKQISNADYYQSMGMPVEDLAQKQQRYLTLVRQTKQQLSTGISYAGDFSGLQAALDQANAKLQESINRAKEFQAAMQQFSNVKGIVDTASAIGRLASGISSIKNLGSIWTDENLSGGEKLLRTVTNLGMAIPMLVSAYKTLQTTTATLSAKMINQAAITEAMTAAEQAQVAVKNAKNLVQRAAITGITIEKGQVITLAAAQQMQAAATQKATVAQAALNTAMSANPIGAIITGITLAITAITALVGIYDKFTMSVKEADQAIDAFNQKQTELASNSATFHQQTSTLAQIRNQYELLAEKAGAINFDNTIDNLTEAERQRYNQLKNIIVSYNEETLAGYNAQGQAILNNNTYIESQIQLLKQKRQAQIDSYVSSQDFNKADKGYQLKATTAENEYKVFLQNREETDYNQLFDEYINTLYYQVIEVDGLRELYQDEIIKIGQQGIQGLQKNLSKLQEIKIEASKFRDTSFYNSETASNVIDRLQQIANLDVQQARLRQLADQATRIPADIILTRLQSSQFNSQYNKLSQSYGQAMINSLVRNYIEGINNGEGFIYSEDFGSIEAVQQIKEQLLQTLMDSQISYGDIQVFQKKQSDLIQSIVPDQTSINEYKQKVSNFIQRITRENQELLKLAQNNPQIYSDLIKSIFGFSDISYEIDQNGNIIFKDFVDITTKKYDSAIQQINTYFEQHPLTMHQLNMGWDKDIEDFLSKDFNLDLLDSVDIFLDYFSKATGTIQERLDSAAQKTRNLAQVMSGVESLSLLKLRDSGQTLNDEQTIALQDGLNKLKQTYPQVTNAVEILNKQWLEGTALYQRALQNVKNAVFDSFSKLGQYDDTILEQMSSLITTSEDLQNAITQNQAIFSTAGGQDWYVQQLEKIASGYESCTNELNRYLLARQQGNLIQEQAAKFDLQLAIRSAQNSQLYGIQAQRISQVAKQFVEYAKAGQEGYQGLEENAQLATDAATRYLRLNDAIADLQDNMQKYSQVLDELNEYGVDSVLANEDMAESYENLKSTVADLLDTNQEFLSADFIKNSKDLIETIAQGGQQAQEALRQLQQAAAEEILINLGVDTSALGMTAAQVADWAANLPEGQLGLDDTVFLNKLVWAMQAAGMGADDIQAALGAMQIDVDLAPYEAGLNQAIDDAYNASDSIVSAMGIDTQVKSDTKTDQDNMEVAGYDATPVPMSAPVAIPRFAEVQTPFGVIPIFSGYDTPSISFSGVKITPRTEKIDGSKQTTTNALMATNGRKSSGGKIGHSNKKSPGNKGKGGGGGGGKGKVPTPSTQAKLSTAKIDTKSKTSSYNPYEQEEKSYDRQSKILDQLQNKEKKLVNKDRLKNLQQQNKVLEKQKDILQNELDISANAAAENSTADYARRLKQAFKGISFDKDGQIADINKIQAENAEVYNAAAKAAADAFEKEKEDYNDFIENTWNKYATKDQQEAHKNQKDLWDERIKDAEKAANDSIKKADQVYKEREDLIKSYNDAWKEDQERLKEYNELTQQIYDNLIAISKIKVDLAIDTGDFERDWLDFENKFIKKLDKDDFLGSAKASAKELMSYFNSDQIQKTADQIASIRKEISIMNKGGTSTIYGNNLAQAQEDLEDYMKQQMDDLGDIQDLVDDIKDNYLDALDDAKDKMDDQIDQYERVNDLIDHNVKLVELLYGDKAYDTMNKYYNLQKANNERELQSLKMQQDYWRNLMNREVVGSDAWKQMKENLDDVTDELNDKLEEMIENLSDQWENRVDGIIAKLNNALTGGRGLDYLDEQWDYINNYDDNFLDTFESKFGIDEVTSLYQQAIDGLSGSPANQQKINKLMNEQLKILREKDHLTEYDIERAKAALEVEKARMALEDARYNKTKMRLRRDSQGNYTYQYVADQQKLSDLQSALADAQANLYNMDKEHYQQNLNTLYDTYKDYLDKMRDLTEEYNSTQDEEERKRIQARIDLLKESTNNLMQGLTEDNKYTLQYLNESFFGGMGIDTTLLSAEQQMEIMTNNIPQMNSNIQDLANTIVGEGGILNATADAMNQINEATLEYDKNVKEFLADAGTSLKIVEQVTDKAGNALDKNILQAQDLITANNALIKSCQAQVDAIQKMMSWLDQYMDKVMNVETLIANLRSAYNTGQQLNGSNLKADNITVEDMGLDTTAGMNFTGNPATDAAAVKRQIDALMAQYEKFLSQMAIATFDTGGSTGSWGDASGRLAFLHEKELVLNQSDTFNILRAVEAVRSMTSALDSIASGEISSIISEATGLMGGINNTSALDQNVHIEANFPNVTQHTEIEQAFNNLVNMASMRASGYRD